jgi:predicted kinase
LTAVLYVLIGIQASGKSTWAKANAGRLEAVVVASDEIRNELEAEGIDATNQGDRVFAIFEERVALFLEAGGSVIADATHARRAWRANILTTSRVSAASAPWRYGFSCCWPLVVSAMPASRVARNGAPAWLRMTYW